MELKVVENSDAVDLDAVAAAPEHHRVIFENESVRVLDTIIRPGDSVPVHTHRWPSVVYTLETSDFVRLDAVKGTRLDSRETDFDVPLATPVNLPPLSAHSISNVGDRTMRAITVELKSHGGSSEE